MTLTPTPCSRCGSRWPQPGCYVCADSPEPNTNMTPDTITIDDMIRCADYIHHCANRIEKIIDAAQLGEIGPREATDKMNRILVDTEDFAAMNQLPII
jgi:hypothetical protein